MREVSEAVREMKELSESINKADDPLDECDAFATHIARQLRKLSTPSCILAQSEIQNIVTKFRLKDLQSQQSIQPQSTYYSSSTPVSDNSSCHGYSDFQPMTRTSETINYAQIVTEALHDLDDHA